MNYCTLFNNRYLARGTAMIESLLRHDPEARIVVFAMDQSTSDFLIENFNDRIQVLPLEKLETPEYLKLKKERSFGEYCWTLTPQVLTYALKELKFEHCIYVDADCYFFASPVDKTRKWTKDQDVMITPHNYAKEYDQSKTSGIFCVQYVFIRGSFNGLSILEEWRQQCVDWCYARHENGKFGDQKYLDQWPSKAGVVVCPQIGFGVAPWNVSRLDIHKKNNQLIYRDQYTGEESSITFYHFHDFKVYNCGLSDLSSYRLGNVVKKEIYKPYIEHLSFIKKELPVQNQNDWQRFPSFRSILRWFKRLLTMKELNLLIGPGHYEVD